MIKTGSMLRLVLAASVSISAASMAQAETLADALEAAYRTNPDLKGARADLRAADEGYAQARAGWDPRLELGFTAQYNKAQRVDGDIFSPTFGQKVTNEGNAGSLTVALSQPLYTGGLVAAEVQEALNNIDSQRQTLRGAEANTMFQVVAAYLDVIRDQQALQISRTALDAYRREVDEINARQRAGELTRTDVAQAQAQFQNQQTVVNSAAAQLEASRAAYVAAVGQNPGVLEGPSPLPGVPANVEEAFAIAERNSPNLGVAEARSDAAQSRVAQARAAFRPTITASARYGFDGVLRPFEPDDYLNSTVGQISVTQPIYSGGLRNSQLRQAKAQSDSSRNAVESAYRVMIQNVANAWNGMIAAQRNVEAATTAVTLTQQAFDGMRVEYRADQRSTFELLNAEASLYSAQLSLATARRDQYVASARLLGLIGRLEAPLLVPQIKAYDAIANFNAVRNSGALPTSAIARLLDSLDPINGASPAPAPLPQVSAPILRAAEVTPGSAAALTTQLPTSPPAR